MVKSALPPMPFITFVPQKLRAALLWKMGMSKAQIARQMGFSPQTASRWVEEIEAAIG